MRQREQAICLRTVDYSETSQVVHFLTRGLGVVHLIAKGSKRPKSKSGGAIDLLSEGDLVFSTGAGTGLATLIEFTQTVSRKALRRDRDSLNASLYMIELAGAMLAEADPHPEVFDLLHNGLARLGHDDAPTAAVLAYYQWRLLRNVGLLGDLSRCVSCGAAVLGGSQAWFSSLKGGLVCPACEGDSDEKYHVDALALEGLAVVARAEAGHRSTLDDNHARAVSRVLAYHTAQQIGRRLKMERHVIGRPT